MSSFLQKPQFRPTHQTKSQKFFAAFFQKSRPSFLARVSPMFPSPQDIGLFLRSARTDATIAGLRGTLGHAGAFDEVYRKGDPWASGDPRYAYQRRKYDVLTGLLPPRRFARALDVGAGLGVLSRKLAAHADEVVGVDISAEAMRRAADAHADQANLRFMQADAMDLPQALDGGFDLLVIADTLYYLPPPLQDSTLKALAQRFARLLRPGGVCLLANHYFAGFDADSRLSRRIHQAFTWSPAWTPTAQHRRPFYLVSLLEPAGAP
jgi:SAM-dependent methyltransferase